MYLTDIDDIEFTDELYCNADLRPGFWKRDTPPGFGPGKVCNTKIRQNGTCPNAAQHAE